MSRDYLTTAEVLGLHAVLIQRYGGASGIRDMGSLESSLFRPQCGYYSDIVEESCALMESILINHPFVDGNKRTAFAVCDVFLRINGYRLNASSTQIYNLMMNWISLDASFRLKQMNMDIRSIIEKKIICTEY